MNNDDDNDDDNDGANDGDDDSYSNHCNLANQLPITFVKKDF